MVSFQKFCLDKTTRIPFDDQEDRILEDKYVDILDITIRNLRNKRDIFDRVNVAYVENAITSDDFLTKLNEKLPDGEVPYMVIKRLSEGIFKKKPHELNVEQQSIIKILSIYICISI